MKFLIVNGPNLGFLGKRQPEIYGSQSMDDVPTMLTNLMGKKAINIKLDFFQSNHEGQIIDRLEQAWKDKIDGLVINAGALTHTSLALSDCLAWIKIPCVEVHISNILGRGNSLRHQSLIAEHCIGLIAGFGIMGYALAIQTLNQKLK